MRPRPDGASHAVTRKPADPVPNHGTGAPHESPSWIAGISCAREVGCSLMSTCDLNVTSEIAGSRRWSDSLAGPAE
jgi:hypothetical protein